MVTKLVLYVVDRSAACETARTKVERALAEMPRGSVELEIRNLSGRDHEGRTRDDRSILVVPTLVVLAPERSYLIGEMSEADVVEFLHLAEGASRSL